MPARGDNFDIKAADAPFSLCDVHVEPVYIKLSRENAALLTERLFLCKCANIRSLWLFLFLRSWEDLIGAVKTRKSNCGCDSQPPQTCNLSDNNPPRCEYLLFYNAMPRHEKKQAASNH